MPNLGISELLVILMILLLVFGGSRLPQIGESLGRTMRSFKRGIATNDAIKAEPSDAPPPRDAGSKPSELKAPDAPVRTASALKNNDDVADAELIEKKG